MALQIFKNTPSDAVGADGDYALLIDNRAFQGPKASGTWSGTSYYALQGPSGLPLVAGLGAPSQSVGSTGQVYLDASGGKLWGPKQVSGGWGNAATSSIVGPVGSAGSRFVFGDAPPGLELGDIGWLFFRRTTFDLYYKITNAAAATTSSYPNGWQIIGNIAGQVGPQGPKGDSITGPAGAQGPKGDTGAASTVAGPKGDTGATGAAGVAGSNGLSVVSGTAAPTANDGVVGSPAFINTAAGTLYGAKTSAGWPTSFLSLVGTVPANITGQSLAITLPSSGAVTYPYSLKNAGGTSLFNVDTTGNIAGGNIYGQGTLQMIGAATMAGVSATTLSASGAVTLSSTLAVTGATTLNSTLSVSGATSAAAITSTGTVTGKNVTLTSGGGGTLTFADGTTQSTAATGSGTSGYRGCAQGMIWLPNNTASGTAYSFSVVISYVTGTAGQANIPLRQTMGAAGTIYGVSLSCPGSVSGGAMTLTVLKNGTAVWTQSNAITGNTGATPSDTFVKPSSTISFAANDVLTMTGTFATTGGQAVQANLMWTTST